MAETLKKSPSVLINRREAAELLGMDSYILASWMNRKHNKLPFIKVGNRCMYEKKDVYDFMHGRLENTSSALPTIEDCVSTKIKEENLKISSSALLSRRETAKILGLAVFTLASWAHSGKNNLPFIKVGTRCMYAEDDVYDFLQKGTTQSNKEKKIEDE